MLCPPPRIDGRVVVFEASPSVEEAAVEQLFHAQQERFLPTLSSKAVTTLKPIRKAIPAPRTLPIRIGCRRGARVANLENGNLILLANLRKADFFRKPPGI